MRDRLATARFIQAGFFVATGVALVSAFFRIGGWQLPVIAIFASMPFSFLITTGMRCRSCGVSFYFDPGERVSNSLTGVNLLKPAAERCPKCGASR